MQIIINFANNNFGFNNDCQNTARNRMNDMKTTRLSQKCTLPAEYHVHSTVSAEYHVHSTVSAEYHVHSTVSAELYENHKTVKKMQLAS